MPNWCENKLIVTGSNDILDELVKSLVYEKEMEYFGTMKFFAMNKLHPGLDPEKYPNNWRDWRIANWGTKWECEVNKIDIQDGIVTLHFDSAWSPPIPFIQYISKKYFPTLHFKLTYIELGVWYCGMSECKNGVLTESIGEILVVDENGEYVYWDNTNRKYKYEDGSFIDEEEPVVYFKNSLDL